MFSFLFGIRTPENFVVKTEKYVTAKERSRYIEKFRQVPLSLLSVSRGRRTETFNEEALLEERAQMHLGVTAKERSRFIEKFRQVPLSLLSVSRGRRTDTFNEEALLEERAQMHLCRREEWKSIASKEKEIHLLLNCKREKSISSGVTLSPAI
ncbi:hypothetical protein CDAR_266311 [Caerostris darwini]|uniref:Uncharacterized protein n=1 Tax=Caerostris darwini TaxID=1538125 RepID=A0AAV4W2C7_9ARAC|nr:hypothetical protein CDAR_266311 [Caerostris darwini]